MGAKEKINKINAPTNATIQYVLIQKRPIFIFGNKNSDKMSVMNVIAEIIIVGIIKNAPDYYVPFKGKC